MGGLYLYGIVGSSPDLSQAIRGLGGEPIRLLPRGTVAAVVSRSPLHPWPPDEAHLTLHETVVEEVMGDRPILPARFNTLLRAKEAVIALLDERAQAFRSALVRVEGKVEMGLRVLWEPPCDAEESANKKSWHGGSGTEYLHRRLREERRLAGIRGVGERVILEVQALLHSLAAESCLQRLPTNRLLFTGAYLVERNRVAAFRENVAKAQQELPYLRFLLTGPWPPYHFVNGAQDETEDTLGT